VTAILEANSAIGIFGGTFDPIHKAHLQCALSVYETVRPQKIYFMPCAQTPHRNQPERHSEHRCAMVNLAIADYPFLALDKRECLREGKSYTVDSLADIRKEVGSETALIFILGYDAFLKIESWYRWETLLGLCHLLVINRPGYELPTEGSLANYIKLHQTTYVNDLSTHHAGFIYFHSMPENFISASKIRKEMITDKIFNDDIPDKVLAYIKQHRLY
jgi:nicotinate-nucleotide adenylyltransferase